MNIAEILKDCPRGTKLYSPLYGDVSFLDVENSNYPITVDTDGDCTASFASDGRLDVNFNGECMLFPSKDNRDWSTFKAPKKEYKFKPFDKVLVRDDNIMNWDIDLFSHINNNTDTEYKYVCLNDAWTQCIPYEGNEHLLDTDNLL